MSKQSHKLVLAAALACGLTVSSASFAQDAGAYVIGSLGRSSTSIGTSDLSGAGVTGISTEDNDTGWKVNLGYQINRYWGIEAGYVDFGKFSVKGALGGAPVKANVDVTAWTLAGIGTLPIGDGAFVLLGKLGVARGKASGEATVVPVDFNDTSTDVLFGFGARYNINPKLGVQFDWERYYFDDRAYLYTLGLRYKF